MSDSMIAMAMNGYYVSDPQTVKLGPLTRELARGTVLYPNDILSLSVIQQSLGRRPVVWAATAGRGFAGLGEYVVQKGLGFHLQAARPDTTDPRLDLKRLADVPLDLPATQSLVYDTYRYAGLLEEGASALDPTAASAAASLALPFVQLVYAYQGRGKREEMERALGYAAKLSPNPDLRQALLKLLYTPPGADSPTLGE
jgi:hypothetical protein